MDKTVKERLGEAYSFSIFRRAVPLFLLINLLLAMLSAPASAQILTLRYLFENNGDDSALPNQAGTLRGTGAGYSTTPTAPQGNYSLQTSASGGYFQVADGYTLDLGDQFTLFTFLRVPDMTTLLPFQGNIRTIFTNSAGGYSVNGLRLFINTYGTADRRLILETGNGTRGAQWRSAANLFSTDNAFHSVAVTVNRTAGVAQFYFDGQAVSTTLDNLPVLDFGTISNDNRIGRFGGVSGAGATNANFDSFSLYGGVLSANQIQTLHNTSGLALFNAPEPGALPLVLLGFLLIGSSSALFRRKHA